MSVKNELLEEIEQTRLRYLKLLDSIPEADYAKPSINPAWTVGDVLYHLTLGPWALALEAWMALHLRGPFGFVMRIFPSRLFNRVNAWFARRDAQRLSRAGLAKTYERGHAALRSVLKRAREQDLTKSVVYPPDFVAELTGTVSAERIFRYVKGHFEVHAAQIQGSNS